MDDRQGNGEGNKLLIAASGTGGHLFPAIATAEHLTGPIEWLGVPDRLETELVPACYPLHTVRMGGVQGKLGLGTIKLFVQFAQATLATRRLLQRGNFKGVFTTGGYIAAPAIIAARSLGLPTVLHESNAMPGKVTRWLSRLCSIVAIGFKETRQYLPKQAQTVWVGTPVRSQFLTDSHASLQDFSIPDNVPLIVVIGGSQGAVAVNKLVRAAAPAWLEQGAWVIHQTGNNDPDTETLNHPQYIHRPFFKNVAALFKRSTLVISRAGAGTLTELAMTHTPSVLIPYPFAADDHQAYNANAFGTVGASKVYRQSDLDGDTLQKWVLALLENPAELDCMRVAAAALAVSDSAEQVASLLQKTME
ncbi:undecaprenyldiphospho-muramoylpentapeptide beta-N-acetylglucosaminyltransferase [Leptolyngbyaceae cyanobacterium CCMR0082]|uniref:UDP-N-acetylglucosamine--N-acetylmuramyl-(pentapeptide) pyrophosphoryl-undecaprenol N-acetylglucosamine transferase n=2 Tax=Adonisia turfae TaxID=2950184 RepID=A0A6M0S1U0_9CYAN|nr:undecaprenyldiphospho-muramoylpentapeptide beta-N-acetylglucosaminyltransferase [Adonisia turfae]MDV3350915.1 undecaprenyldiphospho-muramoylpentapeptide beta-N-acetylglucosaminyltransferase [Leptothoe sp. LEGE 181152]NEZ60366.1 undecaprenyldiphospho-muramoylpentapeptide beta-N-acetylglucosaminyltransferase [Adonisia turfae CCMR0081]NEZ61931.1 undecaprenyldiphospho-muramoylpentapeptide beta-N-acetylglucosaminyltransferase [Adonisia turfae CCMR0082]